MKIPIEYDLLSPEASQQGQFSLPEFGKLVAKALEDEDDADGHDWLASLLASSYWRLQGSAPESIRCLHRSLSTVPRQYAHFSLLALANVLHLAHRSDDALVVLQETLRVLSPQDSAIVHLNMGNVLTTLLQFKQ